MLGFRYGVLCAFTIALFFGFVSVTVTAQPVEEGFFIIRQGDFSQPLVPFRQDGSASLLYNFNLDQSNTGLEVPEHSLIMLHVDQITGNVSLILIHSSAQNPAGGSLSISIDGLPSTATLDLTDDVQGSDSYVLAPPTLQASWQWLPEHNDGVVIGNLGQDFEITITPNFISGISGWDAINGQNRVPTAMPNLVEPVTIIGTLNAPPVAHFLVASETINISVGVVFDASLSSDADGVIVQYEWDFDGDGLFEVSSTTATVQHVFSLGGTRSVSLRVTDDTGGTSTFTQTFLIADEIVSAVRSISTPQVLPGLPFRVTVDISMRSDVNGLGLDEILPPGWEVTPIDNAGATFKRSENQWVFPSVLRAGEVRRIVYDVTVRAQNTSIGPLPVAQAIEGQVDSAAPAFRAPVAGETQVEITSCLSVTVALSHLNPSTDVVDLRSSEDITFDQVQRAITFWVEEIGVPHTCNALIDLEALKLVTARELMNVPVDEVLQQIDFGSSPNPTVTRTILTPLPFHQLYLQAQNGDIFTVQVDVTAEQDYNGLALSENLPQSWQLRPIDNNGAAFNPRTREWLFTSKILSGETRSIFYEVVVPSSETVGMFSVTGLASSAAPSFQKATDKDDLVEIVECLAIPVAVAHLDTDSETIDVSFSNQINFDQIQVAIGFWLEDQEVVGSCGKTINFEDIKSLIAHWLTDTPVNQSLGNVLEQDL